MHHITAYGGDNVPSPPLYHRAVVQSPGWVPQSNPSTLSLLYDKFELAAGCLTFNCLSSASEEALGFSNILLTFLASYGEFTWGPIIDGDYVPAEPGKLLLEGKFNTGVQVMAGHNYNEARLFTNPSITTDAAVIDYIDSSLTQASAEIDDYVLNTLYPKNGLTQGDVAFNNYSTQLARAQLFTSEIIVTCNVVSHLDFI
jgi:carboxylesterase type B